MGGQRGEDPLENVACPFLFFLSGVRGGDKHVSGPRLSVVPVVVGIPPLNVELSGDCLV